MRGLYRIRLGLCLLASAGVARPVTAGVDAPGTLLFDFLAEEEIVYASYDDVAQDAPFAEGLARGHFSSDASAFGENGLAIWGGFELEAPDGPRYGMLIVDLDLSRAPLDGKTPLAPSAVRAEYLEKRGDTILFHGQALVGDVWLNDILFHVDDLGAADGDFAFIFQDSAGRSTGCRVFFRGRFITEPSPTQLRQRYGLYGESGGGDEVYVDSSCSGQFYFADEGAGCEGDDAEGGGCGGEDPDSSGCEGDSADDPGCESDAGGSGSCEGDSGGASCDDCSGSTTGACEESARAAVHNPRRRGSSPRGLMRFLPEIIALLFIVWMRRRRR